MLFIKKGFYTQYTYFLHFLLTTWKIYIRIGNLARKSDRTVFVKIAVQQSVLRIRIHFLRIRIRAWKLNPDLDPGWKLNPDPDPESRRYNGEFENRLIGLSGQRHWLS